MPRRCAVFVDGENLRHSIVELFPTEFRQADYLPKRADWAGVFDSLVSKVMPDTAEPCERLRTYWYLVEAIEFSPYRLGKMEPDVLRRVLSKDGERSKVLSTLKGTELLREMQGMVKLMEAETLGMQHRFNGWLAVQNGIATRFKAIEFRRAGTIRYNLFDHSFGTEKAVDVKLATDLIVLRDIYDVAVIVSGDQDYVPAVQVVKDSGKRVVNVAFKTRGGQLLPGGARKLNQMTDWSIEIPYEELKTLLAL